MPRPLFVIAVYDDHDDETTEETGREAAVLVAIDLDVLNRSTGRVLLPRGDEQLAEWPYVKGDPA